nr:MAG TPA: Transcription factor S-II (TFIIS) [Caudoviricetes sp.]DAZ42622.1 MAG TPA: Transcription factor S-II (TFIIS) [Caudoviricetes sp.]
MNKGYSFWTGFLGSNKTVNRCSNCGHTWKP